MKTEHEINAQIGKNVERIRKLAGISAVELCKHLTITHQQLSKCEHGGNRWPACRIYEISRIMGVPITEFFLNMDDGDPRSFNVQKATLHGNIEIEGYKPTNVKLEKAE